MTAVPPGYAPSSRTVRQSGLKKPRPLLKHSTSMQEKVSDSAILESAPRPDRQISLDSARSSGSAHMEQLLSGTRTSFNEETSAAVTTTQSSQRKSSDSSPTTQPLDCNSNNITEERGYDKPFSGEHTAGTVSFSLSRKNSSESGGSGRGRYHGQKDSLLEVSQNPRPSNSLESSKSEGISIATLVTGDGEQLVLTGRNMRTILCAARALLQKLHAKIIKIEQLRDEEDESQVSSERDREENYFEDSQMSPRIREDAFSTKATSSVSNNKPTKVSPEIQYSKEELLKLSQSMESLKPPNMWNLLSVSATHSEVCLPPDKIRDYFDADVFNFHDGTLVVEERRMNKERGEHQFYRDLHDHGNPRGRNERDLV